MMDMERVDNTASCAQPPVPRGTRNQDFWECVHWSQDLSQEHNFNNKITYEKKIKRLIECIAYLCAPAPSMQCSFVLRYACNELHDDQSFFVQLCLFNCVPL